MLSHPCHISCQSDWAKACVSHDWKPSLAPETHIFKPCIMELKTLIIFPLDILQPHGPLFHLLFLYQMLVTFHYGKTPKTVIAYTSILPFAWNLFISCSPVNYFSFYKIQCRGQFTWGNPSQAAPITFPLIHGIMNEFYWCHHIIFKSLLIYLNHH